MFRLLGFLASLLLYFCVATVLAEAGAIGALWYRGHLRTAQIYDVLAAAYGLDSATAKALAATRDEREIQVAYNDILERRSLASLDLDLRESALDNATTELFNQQSRLDGDRQRYTTLLDEFDRRLAELRAGATNQALADVQQTLESMRPEQAKEQIVLMLADNRIDDVVTLLKSMTRDLRKKILAEFQPAEKDKLYEILKKVLSGSGEGDLIDSVREEVEQFRNS